MLRNIVQLLSGECDRRLLRLIEAQEDFFQRWLVCRNIGRVMFACNFYDLSQCSLDMQLQDTCVGPRHHIDHACDMLKPFHCGWARKTDLHIVLANIFECGDMVDLDQSSLTDNRHAVTSMLYFRQNVRGEEDSASLG